MADPHTDSSPHTDSAPHTDSSPHTDREPDSPLLNAPVNRTLLMMAAPISIGMLSTFLFQVVDTYFVGQLGPNELAALSFAASAYFLAVALFMGMAVGVSALVGGALGSGDRQRARRYTSVSLGAALLLSIGLSALGLLTLQPLFSALGAGPELLPLIDRYMRVLYLGLPLLIFGLVGGAAVRATGEIAPPEIIMGLAGVINLVFDYLLIFGKGPFPRLGLEGAAIATVGSWLFIAICIGAWLLRRRLLTLQRGQLIHELREIGRLSAPAIATQVLLPITAMLITYLAARSGPEAVAAFGVAQRIETLALVGISSVTIAIVPFVAQNYGAKAAARIDQAIAFAGKTSFYWGGALCVLLVVFAGPIAGIFTADPQIIHYTKLYFYIVAISYAPYGLVMMTSAIFNGVQIPGRSLRVLLVKTFIFTFPLTAIGALFGATGVFVALSASNVLGALYAARLMKRALAERDSKLAHKRPIDDYLADWHSLVERSRAALTPLRQQQAGLDEEARTTMDP